MLGLTPTGELKADEAHDCAPDTYYVGLNCFRILHERHVVLETAFKKTKYCFISINRAAKKETAAFSYRKLSFNLSKPSICVPLIG